MLDSYQRLAMSTVVAERDELRECLTQQIGRIAELEAQAEELLAMLNAARDVLVAYQKHAGYLPEQGAYSTRMTDAECKLAQAVSDLDAIIAKAEGK